MRPSLLAALALLAGCVTSPPLQIYVLAPPAQGDPIRQNITTSVVQLQPVIIPDYLDTTDILLRVGPHEILTSFTARWAERLSAEVAHALQSDLATRMPQRSVTLAPPTERAAAQVLITVDATDMWLDGSSVLVAHWSIDGHSGHAAFTGASRGRQDADRVGVLAVLIERLADRIAAEPALAASAKRSQQPGSQASE